MLKLVVHTVSLRLEKVNTRNISLSFTVLHLDLCTVKFRQAQISDLENAEVKTHT